MARAPSSGVGAILASSRSGFTESSSPARRAGKLRAATVPTTLARIRIAPLLLVLAALVLAAPAAAAPLPLGPMGLKEARVRTTLAPGVTWTRIARGTRARGPRWRI